MEIRDTEEYHTSSITPGHLKDVRGISGPGVFAVDDSGSVLYYDGRIWNKIHSGTHNHLRGLWGNASSVIAVGDNGTVISVGVETGME